MDLTSLFQWLQDSAVGTAIREGDSLFPWIETIHVLAITFVVGSIAAVDLRLLGWASKSRAFSKVNGEIVPLTWIAFAIALISGGLLFSSKAAKYADNLPFQIKVSSLLLLGINMAVFQWVTYRSIDHWDRADVPPFAARVAGALSLILWVFVVTAGRTIGFTMNDLVE